MTVRILMAGISAVALAAGTASAQNSTNQSLVTQTGTNNAATIDNTRAGNDFDLSTINQNGRDNAISVLQIGDFNTAESRQIGNTNAIAVSQEGNIHRAETFQNSDSNRSAIRQADGANSATVTQTGLRNLSAITQGAEAGANQDFETTTIFAGSATVRAGSGGRVSVSQVGNDFTSTVRQRARSGGQAADDNRAAVTQRGSGNSATVVQDSRGNSATVYQYEGGASAALRNVGTITQSNTGATASNNLATNNRVSLAINGQANTSVVTQDGLNNSAEVTQGLGIGSNVQVSQVGSAGVNRAILAQYGNANAITVAQASAGALATVWQQGGPAAGRSSNNSVDVQQGTGTTGTADFSRAFFGNATSVTGAAASGLSATVTQGNNPAAISWNVAQVHQDGINLSATVQQAGSGTATFANIIRVAQQGSGNSVVAVQTASVGSGTTSAVATGQPGDAFYFAGGTRSAEIAILQSGTGNSATVEQRGQSQYARIEQGPGSGNNASILQDTNAAFATAIIRQTGNNNTYAVTQDTANAYILVSQTGNNNSVTDVVKRP